MLYAKQIHLSASFYWRIFLIGLWLFCVLSPQAFSQNQHDLAPYSPDTNESAPARKAKQPQALQPDVEAVIIRVIDGDSLVVDIPDFPPIVGKNITVRVAFCDTPEKNDKRQHMREKAKAAKVFTEQLAGPGNRVLLKEIRRDKYFRLLAKVEISGVDLTTALIENGHAVPYQGGKKQ